MVRSTYRCLQLTHCWSTIKLRNTVIYIPSSNEGFHKEAYEPWNQIPLLESIFPSRFSMNMPPGEVWASRGRVRVLSESDHHGAAWWRSHFRPDGGQASAADVLNQNHLGRIWGAMCSVTIRPPKMSGELMYCDAIVKPLFVLSLYMVRRKGNEFDLLAGGSWMRYGFCSCSICNLLWKSRSDQRAGFARSLLGVVFIRGRCGSGLECLYIWDPFNTQKDYKWGRKGQKGSKENKWGPFFAADVCARSKGEHLCGSNIFL